MLGYHLGFLAAVGSPGSAVVWLQAASEFGLPIHSWVRYMEIAAQGVNGLMLGLAGCGPQSHFSSLHFTPLSLQGTHESLKGNAKALSTVTAIIDGTGSIGMYSWGMPGTDFPPAPRCWRAPGPLSPMNRASPNAACVSSQVLP